MMNTSDYRVKEGVETVDGRLVPESRIVALTPEAARYDLDMGKIEPAKIEPVAPQKDPIPKQRPAPLPAAPEEPADERL